MKITVIPFGNAQIDETSETVQCQHGGGECDANTYELCAIALTAGHVDDYLPFLVCNAQALPSGFRAGPFPPAFFEKCAGQAGLWWEALQMCHDSLAWQVTQRAAHATPDHPYVPYVMVNGVALEDPSNLPREVCRLYQEAGGHSRKCSGVEVSDEASSGNAVSAETCPNTLAAAFKIME